MSSSEYTKEQQEVVERILKIEKTDYYNILSIDKKSTDIEIKKSYRKLAIKLHPDKNNHPQSAEAFKKLAKAFEVLSDEEKRRIYDQTGSDPDSRGGMPSASSGFARHAGAGGAGGFRGNPFTNMNGGAGMFDDDIFNMFFGGGGMPGGNGFTTFTFGGPGGPTFRTTGGRGFPGMHQRQQHQRRQGGARGANGTANDNENKTLWDQLAQLAPLLVILIPMLFNFLAGDGSSDRLPKFSFETSPVLPVERTTPVHNIHYYIGKKTFEDLSTNPKKLRNLDQKVETYYVNDLRMKCRREEEYKDKLIEESYGWFFADSDKLEKAQAFEMKNCNRLKDMRLL